MATQIDIKFIPAGFAECLQGVTGQVQAITEQIAANATSYVTKGTGFHAEVTQEPRFQDSSYGVTRPIGRVIANDDETSKEEAEYKILSKAVGK